MNKEHEQESGLTSKESAPPLISFYVITCNHERFIREAVAGALAQTWTPLEVVLSDDCSDDNTFRIMEEIARGYSGPHRVILNRNEKRLGIGAHINRILELCTGEWIVASAGDDISLPERTARLYKEWQLDDCRAGLIYSNLMETHEDGADWYELDFMKEPIIFEDSSIDFTKELRGFRYPIHGASVAYPRRTFDQFGPFWKGVVFEDGILGVRAACTGGIILCRELLVRHRNHSGQFTNLYSRQALMDADKRRRTLTEGRIAARRQNLADAETALQRGLIGLAAYDLIVKRVTAVLEDLSEEHELFWGSFRGRWKLVFRDFPSVFRRKSLSRIVFAILPRTLYLAVLKTIALRK